MKLLLSSIFVLLLAACSTGITNRDITKAEADIQRDFEAKQFTVTEVKLTKQSDTTVAGYVRMRRQVPNVGDMEFTEGCSATMDQNTRRLDWKCK